MKVILISDIHIHDGDDPFYRSLLAMIEREVGAGDVLVLAGDIFDFFVGRQPVLLRRYEEFFRLLEEKMKLGARVEYIEGNHDFHLRDAFAHRFRGSVALRVHASETSIALPSGKRLFVSHGDLVDREDRKYLALRVFFRSSLIRLAAMALPGKLVEKIGERSSEASRKQNPRRPEERGQDRVDDLRGKYRTFARSKFQEGYDGVVMGHCHDLDAADFSDGNRRGQYMNIGFPRIHRSYVVFLEEKGLERRSLPEGSTK